jgi:hypothetical protein
MRLQLVEDYDKSADEDIRLMTEEEKKTMAKEEALDLIPNPERENYDAKQKRNPGVPKVTGEPMTEEQNQGPKDPNDPLY